MGQPAPDFLSCVLPAWAVRRWRSPFLPIYVGDDTTDEAVFRLHSPSILSVRVEPDESSAANLHLKGQTDVAKLLAELTRMIAPAVSPRSADPRDGATA